MAINIGYLTANKTSAGDEVYTPFYAVEPLMEFLPKDKKIWCPFDEEWSAFYQYLTEQGFDVKRSSLKDDKDFFHFEPDEWDILVSNPPFSKKNEVLKRAFAFQKPFALLLPVNSIQGKARYKIFNNEIVSLHFLMVHFQERFNGETAVFFLLKPECLQNTSCLNPFHNCTLRIYSAFAVLLL